MRKPWEWDKVWMEMAKIMAMRSKDPDTQVGAAIVSPDNRSVHFGYNGFPANIKDTKERWKRPIKYSYTSHAEMSCLLTSPMNSIGATLYLTLFPCSNCAKHIIQAGIKKIIYLDKPSNPEVHETKFAEELLEEAGVIVEKYKGE